MYASIVPGKSNMNNAPQQPVSYTELAATTTTPAVSNNNIETESNA